MKIYHFTVNFSSHTLAHHAEFLTAKTEKEAIIFAAKVKLTEKMKAWRVTSEELISFEIYDNDRKIIFEWIK